MKFTSSRSRLGLLALFTVPLACSGTLSTDALPEGDNDDDLPHVDRPGGALASCKPVQVERPRLVRLTHREYKNSLRDLLDESVDVDALLAPDPAPYRFDNDAELLNVSGSLARDYRRIAEDLANRMITDPARLQKLVGCAETDNACANNFIEGFGKRALRRPLLGDERAAFGKLFEAGKASNNFATGIAWTLEAMLQTPQFLYRAYVDDEISERIGLPGAFELASTLSYTLWNNMPDEELFAAAEDGSLATRQGLRAQIDRMLSSPKARDMVGDFHTQFIDAKQFRDLQRDRTAFPQFSSHLATAMQREVEAFSAAAILDEGLGVEGLYTAPFTYADSALARLYGVDPPNDTGVGGLGRVELNPEQRGGLLTQIGFLASRAHHDATSPIMRGTFVLKYALCSPTPEPPADVDLTLPDAEPGMTTRELVTRITSGPACVGCHAMINPAGFAFETFNPVGQWRQTDANKPVDSSGSLELESGDIHFSGPMEFLTQVAKTPEAASCYAKNWLSYTLERQITEDDGCLVQGLGKGLGENGFSIKDMIAEVVTSTSFLHRTSFSRGEAP